MLSPKRT